MVLNMVDLWRLGIALFLLPLTFLIVEVLDKLGSNGTIAVEAFIGLISFAPAIAGSIIEPKTMKQQK
jgi:hypothetical protein